MNASATTAIFRYNYHSRYPLLPPAWFYLYGPSRTERSAREVNNTKWKNISHNRNRTYLECRGRARYQMSLSRIAECSILLIHVIPINWNKFGHMKKWNRAYFDMYIYYIVLDTGQYLHWANSKMTQKFCVCFQYANHDQTLIWYV